MFGHVSGMGQNLVPLANIKIAGILGIAGQQFFAENSTGFWLLSCKGSISGYSPSNIVISSKKNGMNMDEYYSYPYLQICVDACFFAGDRDTGRKRFWIFLGGWGGVGDEVRWGRATTFTFTCTSS